MDGINAPFFAYEGLRIALPGLVAYGLLRAALTTLGFNSVAAALAGASAGVGVSVGAGLLLYFLDIPALTPLYKNQPAAVYFRNLETNWPNPYSSANRYFIAFDTNLPANLRDRSSYFTEVYRIGFEVILLTTLAEAGVWGALPLNQGRTPIPWLVSACAATAMAASFLVRAQAERARDHLTLKHFVSRLWTQLGPVRSLAALSVVPITLVGRLTTGIRALPIVVASFPLVAWLITSVRGINPVQPPESSHGRVDREQATADVLVLLFGAGMGGAMLAETDFTAVWFGGRSATAVISWGILTIATTLLIAFRGHESRFLATNYEQREWLALHEDELKGEFGIRSG